MQSGRDTNRNSYLLLRCCAGLLGLGLLAGCSSSFGGGAQPQPNTVVVPPGTTVVCQDGSAPPCR